MAFPFMAMILEDRGPVFPHMIIQFAGYSPSSSHSIQMEPLQTHQKQLQYAPLMVLYSKNNFHFHFSNSILECPTVADCSGAVMKIEYCF